jgi:hypothetical protein
MGLCGGRTRWRETERIMFKTRILDSAVWFLLVTGSAALICGLYGLCVGVAAQPVVGVELPPSIVASPGEPFVVALVVQNQSDKVLRLLGMNWC